MKSKQSEGKQHNYTQDNSRAALCGIQTHDALHSRQVLYQQRYTRTIDNNNGEQMSESHVHGIGRYIVCAAVLPSSLLDILQLKTMPFSVD